MSENGSQVSELSDDYKSHLGIANEAYDEYIECRRVIKRLFHLFVDDFITNCHIVVNVGTCVRSLLLFGIICAQLWQDAISIKYCKCIMHPTKRS